MTPWPRLSQSSEHLAHRSIVPVVMMPEPPECGGDEPPPAGTAFRSTGRCQAAGALQISGIFAIYLMGAGCQALSH
jgi:hypothetical protein